ncbi:MAG: hypothetical protein ABL901_12280 [Hyphomicrobiaceae bacterium]
MAKHFRAALAIATGVMAVLTATAAQAYSDKINQHCEDDYFKFCSAHAVGSTGLRRCMEANGKQLSRRCVNALADAGEIPRKYRK